MRTLQPLLEERHVSRAAKRSFLSQPAMSRALDRLRDTFEDVAVGRIDLNLCAEEVLPALESEVILNLDFVCLVGSGQLVRTG